MRRALGSRAWPSDSSSVTLRGRRHLDTDAGVFYRTQICMLTARGQVYPPVEDIFEAVKAALGPQATTDSFARDTALIGYAIYQARIHEPTRSPKARRERLKHLRKTMAKISQLMDLLQTTIPDIQDQLNILLSESVGTYLSVQAFEDAGIPINTETSIHTLLTREGMSRAGPYRTIEVEVAASRVFAASKNASSVLSSVLRQLKSRIGLQIALMGRAAGGNPGNIYRSFAIQRLADTYHMHLSRAPTTTNTGRFVKLCKSVLPLFEIGLDGLDQVVQRELKIRRKKSAPRT